MRANFLNSGFMITCLVLLSTMTSAQTITNTLPLTGNVGIGTTTPAYPLTVAGPAAIGDTPAGASEPSNIPLINKFLGTTADAAVNYILLAYPNTNTGGFSTSGFDGQVYLYRGNRGAWNGATEYDLAVKDAYDGYYVMRFNSYGSLNNANIVKLTYSGSSYLAVQIPASSSMDVYVTGRSWGLIPVLATASQVSGVTQITMPYVTANSSGNIGIGTNSSGQLLQVGSTYSQKPSIMIGGQDSNNSSNGSYSLLFGAYRDVESITSGIVANPVWTCCGGYPSSGYPGVRLNSLGFYTAYNPTNPSAHSPNMLIAASGNVGIGNTSPNQLLQVGSTYSQNPTVMIGEQDSNNSSTGHYSLLFGAFRDVEYITSGIVATPVWTCCGGYPSSGYPGVRLNSLGFYTAYNPSNPSAHDPNLLINSDGNVGVGTKAPGAKLEINGNLLLTKGSGASITFQDGSQQTVAWTGSLCGGDYAESIDVSGDRTKYEPGDVLVIDPDNQGKFLKSAEAYSTAVTGIYSTKPGVIGRRQTSPKNPDEVPMAMIGIVPTKVSAENGSIKPGDLLVTSSTLGYAMKGTDRSRMLGAVIGKALGTLESGTGVIEVVINVQ